SAAVLGHRADGEVTAGGGHGVRAGLVMLCLQAQHPHRVDAGLVRAVGVVTPDVTTWIRAHVELAGMGGHALGLPDLVAESTLLAGQRIVGGESSRKIGAGI